MGRRAIPNGYHAGDCQQFFAAVFLDFCRMLQLLRQMFAAQLHRLGKTGDLRRSLGAGAQAAFLAAAGQQRTHIAEAVGNIQGADPLRAADFVSRKAHHVHAPAYGVAIHFHEALHRITVQQRFALFCFQKLRRFLHREEAAGFIVDQHHGNEHRILAQGILHLLHMDITVLVRLQIRHFPALLFQPFAGFQNGAVFHGGGNDMPAVVPALPDGGLNGPVVAFRAAGGKVKILTPAAQRPGNDAAAALHQLLRLLSHRVLGGGITELSGQNLIHGIGHRLGYRRGSGMIQIYHEKHLIFVKPGTCHRRKNRL